ncbi:MAG: NAD(P)/FAD-dependent oxidoreductase [Blautia sp.]|jgi:predicted Rossmann fold flavoprotein
MIKVAITGGGAAGMLAAVYAARQEGVEVTLYEQNEKLGKKLYITGKGRCNLTNACEVEELFPAVVSNSKFLYSAFYSYTNQDVMDFFQEELGVPLKVERGNRVFPASDHSSDIIRALEREMKRLQVKICLNTKVDRLLIEDGQAQGLVLDDGRKVYADRVIVATGGLSYPSTGATGDGYRFAEAAGLQVTEKSPSLVPMYTEEEYTHRLSGLSLKNAALTIWDGKKKVFEDFGEMMFTHFGITGPMVLSASAHVGRLLLQRPLQARLDLKPARTREQLDERILREFDQGKNKQLKNVIGCLYPSSLTPVILEAAGVSGEKKIHDVSKEERLHLIEMTKSFPMTITGLGEFKEAVITRGGVSVKEISPGTMESKKVKHLYFIGEVLDLDAVTGGYNLQIAWSTAYLAAMALTMPEKE